MFYIFAEKKICFELINKFEEIVNYYKKKYLI